MTSESEKYHHRAVRGLPKSALGPNGTTVEVIALMQSQAGLNRELRRQIRVPGRHVLQDVALQKKLGKDEWNILTHFLSADERYRNFWTLLKQRKGTPAGKASALAVDVQFFQAYDAGWKSLQYDADSLVARCPEWDVIRAHLEKHALQEKTKNPFGVFMLWLQLCDDFSRWDALSSARRTSATRAVFSLSSIAWSQWFVEDAIRQCAALDDELGHLLREPELAAHPAKQGLASPQESQPASASVHSRSDLEAALPLECQPDKSQAEVWKDLGGRVRSLSADWSDGIRRELLQTLRALGNDAANLLDSLPDAEETARSAYRSSLAALQQRLEQAVQNEEIGWLGGADVDGILAQWQAALQSANDRTAIESLSRDADQALVRFADAAAAFGVANANLTNAREANELIVRHLTEKPSALQRIELTEKLLLSREEVIGAERELNRILASVLTSVSPPAQPSAPAESSAGTDVDQGSDVDAVPLAGHPYSDGLSAEAQSKIHPPYPDEPAGKVSPDVSVLVGGHEQQQVDESGVFDSDFRSDLATAEVDARNSDHLHSPEDAGLATASPVNGNEPSAAQATIQSAQSRETTTTQVEEPEQVDFSDEAGELCRPVWQLLHEGRPALAFQFGMALQEAESEVRVPPPQLLRSVVLAQGLFTSDGSLAISIAEALAEIDPAWFEPSDAPSNWHTALNLLLLAATLRPMLLAPGTGAAAVARYRHLDGRHVALLELVQKVSELSESLMPFTIGPAALRSVADGASQKAQLIRLSKQAEDWLNERAPNKKIRYAPASQVLLQWLRPGEAIHKMLAPVIDEAVDQRAAVRAAIDELSDYHLFVERVRETDRRQVLRRGQEIQAGALDHLWIATREAVALAKEWLTTASLIAGSSGRLPGFIEKLRLAFEAHADRACAELSQPWNDEWGQVEAASQLLRAEVGAIADMFKEADVLPPVEPSAEEMLSRDLLRVPGISLERGWKLESDSQQVLEALRSWSTSPVSIEAAVLERVKSGDLEGAELLLQSLPLSEADEHRFTVEKAREPWVRDLQRHVQDTRRASEVGLAYGYLSDAERADFESEISSVEVALREIDRFDRAADRLEQVRDAIEKKKAQRIDEARRQFEREKASIDESVIAQLDAPLQKSDIHTFNELLQRVRQGADPWPEKESRQDPFQGFYPDLQLAISTELSNLGAASVDKLIRSGGRIGPLSFDMEGDREARIAAEECYGAWATSFSRRGMSRENVRKVLEALGIQARNLDQDRSGQGWTLQTSPIDDRDICPVPHFGSRARGRYRVLVFQERLTPEDLLRSIGDSTQQIATLVLYQARPPARFWTDIARLSKERQRSFLLLDESMLLYLLAQRGSRLGTWFGIALPFTYSEPYDASAGFVPSEMFYGRTSELESVKAQGGCYFIYGGRQLGKTALLRRAERTFLDPRTDQYAIWVDLLAQGIGERRPASDVWLSIADKLRELKIDGLDAPTVNPAKPASIDAFLSSIKEFLTSKPGRRVLVLLDEADRFFEQDGRQGNAYAETRRLKQLMDETERRFKVVFAGLHNVLRTATTSNQPLGHLNEAVRIGPLMNEREIRAAEALITRPVEAAGYEFEDRSLVMRVLAQTNYYPSLIQLYCTQLLRHVRESKLRQHDVRGPRFIINESDIESVFSGRPLRDAIRSKFRLTLQLDDRYEVIANAIGLEALTLEFDHAEGIEWRKIRQDCMTWWAEGFATTSERDFLVLLEEMVALGVLSEARATDRFSLRNPNVLLLLGSKQEIENTLQAEREPRTEFESTIFRPALGGRIDVAARNPLTYRQLDEIVQARSSVLLVAASAAGGGGNLLAGLRGQLGSTESRLFVLIEGMFEKKGFIQALDKQFKRRANEGVTIMFVPASVPWTADWVSAARAKVSALKSISSFVSVVFHADPERLWTLAEPSSFDSLSEPWLSVLPWTRSFVRKWLEELQLPVDLVDRLRDATGYWGGLLQDTAHAKAGALEFAQNLDRILSPDQDANWRENQVSLLTGGIEEARTVLKAMRGLGDGVTEDDLVQFGEVPRDLVQRFIRWASPLGLIVPESGSTWAMNPFLGHVIGDEGR